MSVEWPERTMRAFKHYGIDPDERKYKGYSAPRGGWCKACLKHSASNPFQLCDLEIARAEDIEEHGFEARHCFWCRKAYPLMFDSGGLCPICRQKSDERDRQVAEELRQNQSTPNSREGAFVRVDDGLGCTEALPRWSVDWDGDPGYREPR